MLRRAAVAEEEPLPGALLCDGLPGVYTAEHTALPPALRETYRARANWTAMPAHHRSPGAARQALCFTSRPRTAMALLATHIAFGPVVRCRSLGP